MEGERITPPQRRALFAAAGDRGLSIDDIRDMTPAGSISALSRAQASDLLDRINSGTDFDQRRRRRPRGPRRPKGVFAMASPAQRAKIKSLRIDLGWTAEGLVGFLADRHYSHGGPMSKILTTADASEVIELLKAVMRKQVAARAKRTRNAASNQGDDDARRTEAAMGDVWSSDRDADELTSAGIRGHVEGPL